MNELAFLEEAKSKELTLMEGLVLDMVAEGKSAREIAGVVGISPADAHKMAYDLLDKEIITDVESRRKLNVYRLEKIVEALWQRTMKRAEKDDVKNLVDVLDKLNVLLGLNKELDAELAEKMYQHQFYAYMNALKGMIVAFMAVAPNIMTEAEWAEWAAGQLEEARKELTV